MLEDRLSIINVNASAVEERRCYRLTMMERAACFDSSVGVSDTRSADPLRADDTPLC